MKGRDAYPERAAGRVDPLVTAAEAFPAMEELALGARRELGLGLRIFDPFTALRSEAALAAVGQAPGEGRWIDLLQLKHREGVAIRVALSDFDPVGAPDLHAQAWSSAIALGRIAEPGQGAFSVLVALHPSKVGRWLRRLLWPAALVSFERQRQELNALTPEERRARFLDRPGLWTHLRLKRNGLLGWRVTTPPRLHPVTHHHKILVADRQRAIIGGLDIDERRFDDPTHERPSDETWHDVSLLVDGPIAADIAEFLDEHWERNRRAADRRRRRLARLAPSGSGELPLPPAPAEAAPETQSAPERSEGGDAGTIRLLRTISDGRRSGALRLGPRPRIREFLDGYGALIAEAQESLYVETQFFRSRRIAEALAEAAARRPGLELVMVVPAAPETVAFEGAEGLPEQLGEHLHSACVATVREAFGDRAAILSPARPVAAEEAGRHVTHGAEIVYVHAKLMIADLSAAIVSSANLNGRSIFWDTEAGVLVRDRAAVGRLAEALATHWWPTGPDAPAAPIIGPGAGKRWGEAAARLAERQPELRAGFLVPHDTAPAEALGNPVPFLPEELV